MSIKNTATISLARFKELENKESVLSEILQGSEKLTIIESGRFIEYGKTIYSKTKQEEIKNLIDKLSSITQERDWWQDQCNKLRKRSLFKRIFNYEQPTY